MEELTTGTCVRLKSGRVAKLIGPVGHPHGPMMLVQDYHSIGGSEYRVPVERVDSVLTELEYHRLVRVLQS